MSRSSLTTVAAAAAALALAACADAPLQPAGTAPLQPPFLARAADGAEEAVVAGEVLVKVRDGESLDEVLRPHGSAPQGAGYGSAFAVARAERGNERALAARLAADPRVEFAEPNYIRRVDTIDPRLWAFYNPGGLNMKFNEPGATRDGTLIPSSYASKADADEDNIEGYAAGGADVVIGSLDTGVDFAHPEFAGRLIAGRDWVSGDADPSDTPDEGHGTHTTGTMAGARVGVAGVSGAAPHVQVYVQRVCGPSGCPTSAIVNAINAAADQPGMVAMNLSLGGTSESIGEKNAIQYATRKGVLVIASAGNSGAGTVACPACDANAISVASTTWQDQLAGYSQYGRGLDISAPGGYCYSNTTEDGCIFSAIVSGYTAGATYSGPLNDGRYAYMQGTSMAAPQVTGVAAIVASKTGLRGSALRKRIEGSADDLGAAGYDTRFGNGRVNAYRAVKGATLAAPQ
jgi:subtilisin family serine protease